MASRASGNSVSNPFAHGYNDPFAQPEQRPPSRLDSTQAQVQEVVTIMQSNVNKVMERDARLNDLDSRADALSQSAQMFERSSTTLRKKMWWNNLKWKIILGLVLVAVIVGIGFWIASSFSGGSDSDGDVKKLLTTLFVAPANATGHPVNTTAVASQNGTVAVK